MRRAAAATGGAGAVAEPARSSKDTLLASARQKAEAYVQSKQKDLATRDVLPELANARSMDTERWRKLQGLGPESRVFIITGIYPDVRDALLRRGWKQNKDEESPHFDMKFALKNSEIPYATMTAQQVGNHFKGAGSITTKAGLVHCLRSAHWFVPADQFAFYPRAYDLGDAGDYADFVDDFRCVEAEKVLRAVLLAGAARARAAGLLSEGTIATAMAAAGPGCAASAAPSPAAAGAAAVAVDMLDRLMVGAGAALAAALLHPAVAAAATASLPSPLLVNAGVVGAAVSVSSKRCREWSDEELDSGGGSDAAADAAGAADAGEGVAVGEPLVTPGEWEVLRYCSVFAAGGPVEQAPITRRAEEDAKALERDMNIKRDKLIRRLRRIAKRRAAAAASSAAAGGGGGGGGESATGSLAAAMAEALAKSSLAAVLEGRVAKDDEELTSLKALTPAGGGAAAGGGGAAGDEDDGDDDDGGDDDSPSGGADESSEDDSGSDDSDSGGAGAGRGAVAARGRSGVGISIRGGAASGRRAGAAGGGGPRPPGKAGGGAAFGHSLPPAPGGSGSGSGSGKTVENSDDFNNGTGRVTNLKDRAAVAAFQLRMWRERLVKEGASAGAAEVYSDSLGDPAPTISSASAPAFAALVPLTAALWGAAVQCIARINDSPACQVSLNAAAPKNIWIVKPAGKSRGRGIECAKTLAGILYNRGGDGHAEAQYVVQKYIERPLLVRGFKWDIRQWVLVASWAPLAVWVYDRCYLRFCTYPFELDNLSNRYIHLSNNSVQKNNVAFDDAATGIEGSMWHAASFAEWLAAQDAAGAWRGLTYVPDPDAMAGNCNAPPPGSDGTPAEPVPVSGCGDVWGRVLLPSMRRIIAASLQAGQEKIVARPRSFEIYGYDFMVDERLNPWLIEINASPDFSYSTPVTEALVKEASEDAMKVVVDYGGWEEASAAAVKAARKDGASGGSSGTATPLATATAAGGGGGGASSAPSTGGWQCIFRSQAAPGRATMTCAAHGIFCAGTAIKPPPGSAAAAAAAAARRTARTVIPTLASGVVGSGLPVGAGASSSAAGSGAAAPRKLMGGGGAAGKLIIGASSSSAASSLAASSLAVTPPVPPMPMPSVRGERPPRGAVALGGSSTPAAASLSAGRTSGGRAAAALAGPTAAAAAAGVSGRRAVSLSTARIDGFADAFAGPSPAAAVTGRISVGGAGATSSASAATSHSGIPASSHAGRHGGSGTSVQQPPRYPSSLPSGKASASAPSSASSASPLPISPGAPAPGASHFGFGVSVSGHTAAASGARASSASGGSSRARSTSRSAPSRPRSTSRGASSGPGR